MSDSIEMPRQPLGVHRAAEATLQPFGRRHEVLECSDVSEFLEVTSPAEFVTTPG